jgi:hypothetical protein
MQGSQIIGRPEGTDKVRLYLKESEQAFIFAALGCKKSVAFLT